MVFNARLYATAALASFMLLAPLASAQAGQLFPPNNIGSNPNVPCPNGSMLDWTGDAVECTDPTPGVTVSCPQGQVLNGITNGKPVCSYGKMAGVFVLGDNGFCIADNPVIGACSCPGGYAASYILDWTVNCGDPYYNGYCNDAGQQGWVMYQCVAN